MSGPGTKHFDFRKSIQMYDQDSGTHTTQAVKVVMKCNTKSTNLGTVGTAQGMGSSTEHEVTYLLISIEGRTVLEIDKFNYVYRVFENGQMVDYLEKTRRDLGLA